MAPLWKREVAVRNAEQLSSGNDSKPSFPYLKPHDSNSSLRLGFLSYDFNDHPTGHLSEGLFFWNNITSTSIQLAAYNYGKDDNSTFRRNIEEYLGGEATNGGRFFDLTTSSHLDSIQMIRNDKPHIVFDIQGFTRGARPEIVSKRVAPLQVNYLGE